MRAELSSSGRRHASIVIWWEKSAMTISARPASIADRLLPVLSWLPSYRRDWLLPDVLAGLAVSAVLVTEGMYYDVVVGRTPIVGILTIVPTLIGFLLLCYSLLMFFCQITASQPHLVRQV